MLSLTIEERATNFFEGKLKMGNRGSVSELG